MRLRYLRYFVVLAEERNFHRAAARLHIDQSPLSRAIKTLENELGAGFFERTQRGSTITPAWRALLGDARRILATYDLARKNIRETSATFQHRLCIGLSGMTVGLAHPKLTRLLACHRRQSITVDLSVTEYQYDAMLRDVRDGLVDVGITLGGVHADDLVVSRLWDDPILAVVAADHALAGRESPGPPALGPIISLGYASVRKCLAMGSPRPCRQYCGCAKLLLYRRGCSTASSSARGRSGPRSST